MRQRPVGAPVLLLVVLLALIPSQALSYKMGDAVGLLVRTPSRNIEALRSQMPLFGVSTSTNVAVEGGSTRRLSLSFGDGSSSVPWFDVSDGTGRKLEVLTVTFVYSSSGGGEIHAVSSRTQYGERDSIPTVLGFRVDYVWVEEADVDAAAGAYVLFLVTLVAALFILVQACASMGRDEEELEGTAPTAYAKDY